MKQGGVLRTLRTSRQRRPSRFWLLALAGAACSSSAAEAPTGSTGAGGSAQVDPDSGASGSAQGGQAAQGGGGAGGSAGADATGGSAGAGATGGSTGAGATGGSAGASGSAGSDGGASSQAPAIAGCTMFSADDPWRQDMRQSPVDATWTAALVSGATKKTLHPDFGNAGTEVYGIPINVVPMTQAKVPVSFDYADESDPGPYPFPSPSVVKIEGGSADNCDGDCHVLAVQQGTCRLFEGWACGYASGWHCGSGAVFDLTRNSYGQRPAGFTSADAAGLAITPGLVRFSEVAEGVVRHAIRITMHCTQDGYVAPASHFAVPTGSGGCPARASGESVSDYHARLRAQPFPPMGLRIRLKSSYAVASLPRQAAVIAQAMQTYGMILADNGSDYYFQGDVDPGWNDELDALKAIPADAFEVLRPGTIVH